MTLEGKVELGFQEKKTPKVTTKYIAFIYEGF